MITSLRPHRDRIALLERALADALTAVAFVDPSDVDACEVADDALIVARRELLDAYRDAWRAVTSDSPADHPEAG